MTAGGPLTGTTVVVTRAADQAPPLTEAIDAAGGSVVELPLLLIAPPDDGGGALRHELARLRRRDWLAVASPNAARSVVEHAEPRFRCRLAVVAPGTAAPFLDVGWEPDLVADIPTAAGLVAAFPPPEPERFVLVPQGDLARPTLVDGLRAQGWPVRSAIAYVNRVPPIDANAIDAARHADAVVFASPSAVDRYCSLLGVTPIEAIAIGEVTATAARNAGFHATVAPAPTVDGLLDALVAVRSR